MEVIASPGEEAPKKDRRRRTNANAKKSEHGRTETFKPYGGSPNQNPPFKVNYPKRDESAGPSSSGEWSIFLTFPTLPCLHPSRPSPRPCPHPSLV
jgi:hypothetical protein